VAGEPEAVDTALLSAADAAFDALPDEAGTAPDALRRLAVALARGRLSHALLVAGPRGCGKRHVAVRLAQLTACDARAADPEILRPCRECPPCRRVERGLDPDVMLLEPPWDKRRQEARTEILVEQVRDLQERLTFRSTGRRRFVIVAPADRLSPVAEEALLKTLEEPPAGVVLALLTTRPSRLKPTVRSRCQLTRVAAPSAGTAARVLQELRGLSADEARRTAALAGGDLRRALDLDFARAGEEWLHLGRRLYEVLGARGASRCRDLAQEVVPKRGEEGSGRGEVADWLDLLERVVRDVMVAGEQARDRSAAPLGSRLVNPGAETASRALAARLPPDAAARALEEVQRARDDLALHLSQKLVLTHLLLALHGLARPVGAGRPPSAS
jgi:DNA polymerase-3 subunit delta'